MRGHPLGMYVAPGRIGPYEATGKCQVPEYQYLIVIHMLPNYGVCSLRISG